MADAANPIPSRPDEAAPAGPPAAGPLVYSAKQHAAVRTDEYLYNQLIPYIGNKRKLLWLIAEAIRQTGITGGTFVDFFAGSSVVARLAKTLGYRVVSNDWEPYAHILNQCYVQCNTLPAFAALGGAARAFVLLNEAAPMEGYVARHLCPRDDACPDPAVERMFFTHANGAKIDAMREQIRRWEQEGVLTDDETAVLLAALVYAVSYTSNTSGVFKGFHRGWGGSTRTALYRILSQIELRPPVLHDNGLDNQA
jgi:adenine-specific DNA-methyltransferase